MGIKVISFNWVVDTDEQVSQINIDNKEFGAKGAQWLVDKLEGKGKIICLNGKPGNTVNDERWEGAKSVFDKYSDIEIVGVSDADWDYAKGKAAVESLLSANDVIDGVWSQGGAMTQGSIDAFVANERPLVPMVGEANNGVLKSWKKYMNVDDFDSICLSNPSCISAYSLDALVNALDGKEIDPKITLPIQSVTVDNIDEYYREDLPDSFWVFTHLNEENLKAIYQ